MKFALASFQTLPLKDAARQLLAKLGYKSEKFLVGAGSKPQDFLNDFASGHPFDQAKALVPEWKSADLLFQLTDQELSRESSLFTDNSVQAALLKSYIFIAIELKGNDYARGKFSAITRQINRLFPMPVMVIFKHGERLTIAVINRRRNKIDDSKDVLEKATLIRDISIANPHRGHLDILASLALPNLAHPKRLPITDFDTLHAAWEQIFNVELLNERFYRELANWYFWALPQVEFPADLEPDDEKRRATGLIRLLTRLIFCWFLKEKGLIPDKLFHATDLTKLLKGFDAESETSSTYYQAILQNLFFATLNQRMGKDGKGTPYRVFAKDEGFQKNRATYDINNLYRYEKLFAVPEDEALALFAEIPFLNGGLFECLDRTEDGTDKKRYLDGFSRNPKKRPHVPDRLFFDSGEITDLSEVYDDKKRKAEKVTGLITILNRYKFTIVENTPIDQEIALDPELLGKVFENLLASYNEETKTTARKQTGSFYTPRPIVDYMVDESLKAHFTRALVEQARMKEPDARAGLDLLFAYTEKEHAFTPAEVATLIAAIDALKILDPACGSGAFPMGVLHKLVYALGKLDPDNTRWKQTQLAKLDSAPMREELERAFADNNDDYGRKLSLIENCLYGVDIQPIAIQITKLRFFISLVCDQKTNQNKAKNHNIKPLPNLETKFVAADTLIGLPEMDQMELVDPRVYKIEAEIETLYHNHFSEQRRDRKLASQRKVKALRKEMADVLAQSLMSRKKSEHIAEWDPFDPQSSADFFDPHWMFGKSLAGGFDIVIGNPPYGAVLTELAKAAVGRAYKHQDYQLDTYLLFVERGIQLLRRNGIQSFIIPNTWLPSLMLKSIRKFVVGSTTLVSLADIRTAVFAAVVDTTILTHRNFNSSDNSFPIYAYTDAGFELLYQQKQNEWNLRPGEPISVALTPTLTKIAAQISGSSTLGDLFVVTQGSKLYQTGKGVPPQNRECVDLKPFTSDYEKPGFRPLLRGKHVVPYQIKWDRDLWVKYGPWLAEPRESAGFDEPEKIVIRQTGDTLIAALDTKRFVTMDNLYTIRQRTGTHPLPCLLALLNSSVLRWYYRKVVNPEVGEALAQVKKGHLVRLPIPELSDPASKLLGNLTKLIQFAKADTGASPGVAAFLEDLIDACVMESYFRDHMAEPGRDLLFHDTLAPHLSTYDSDASEAAQQKFLTELHQTLNAPSHPVRNRLLRLTADSPNLLAVIKQEGKI